MRLVFTESAWQDYLWFQEKQRPLLKRINQLIRDALRTPLFLDGATAEEIAQQCPSLDLADVYSAIAYCLRRRAEVDTFLR